jgi:hypothetical protein
MKLKAQLTGLRFFEELAAAGVVEDPGAVNRVVIDARRGELVTITVETIAGDKTVKALKSLLDGLDAG